MQKVREIYEADHQRVVFTTAKPGKNFKWNPKHIIRQAISLVPKSKRDDGMRKVYHIFSI